MLQVERAPEDDAELQAKLDALMQADEALKSHFNTKLTDPVPFDLAKTIEDFDVPAVANTPTAPKAQPGVSSLTAAIALIIGLAGGYLLARVNTQPTGGTQIAARGWLDDIAPYHRVYAAQKRHLVEVAASEAAHIETWLTSSGPRLEFLI